MAKPRFLRSDLGLIVLAIALLSQAPAAVGQYAPYPGAPQGPYDTLPSPLGFSPQSPFPQQPTPSGMAMQDPSLIGAYYQMDPRAVAGSRVPYFQAADGSPYAIDFATYEQAQPDGLALTASGARQQPGYGQSPYGMMPGAYPNQIGLTAYQEGPINGENGGLQPQAMPRFGVNGEQFGAFVTPDPVNPNGGVNYRPGHNAPSWLKTFETGFYGNYDQVVFSAGGIVSLYEAPLGAVAARMLATGVIHSQGDGEAGFTVDMWASRQINILGYEHFLKLGGFYDRQNTLGRAGLETAGILFTDLLDCPPTYDIAVGFGEGEDFIGNRFRRVADVDVQMRFGLVLNQYFSAGVSAQTWHWDDPQFEESIWSFGGFARIELGPQTSLTCDVNVGQDDVAGFVNLVWQPQRRLPRHIVGATNVASQDAMAKYRGWHTTPVMRDLSLRTGQDPSPGDAFANLLGNLGRVICRINLPGVNGVDDDPANPGVPNGIVDPGDEYEIQILFMAGSRTATGVAYQGVGGATSVVTGNATEVAFVGSTPVFVPAGTTVVANGLAEFQIAVNATAAVDDQIFVDFEVTADGQTGLFRCGPVIVGTSTNGQTDTAEFLGLVP